MPRGCFPLDCYCNREFTSPLFFQNYFGVLLFLFIIVIFFVRDIASVARSVSVAIAIT